MCYVVFVRFFGKFVENGEGEVEVEVEAEVEVKVEAEVEVKVKVKVKVKVEVKVKAEKSGEEVRGQKGDFRRERSEDLPTKKTVNGFKRERRTSVLISSASLQVTPMIAENR